MAECRWCGKKGFLLQTNADGICRACEAQIHTESLDHARTVWECVQLLDDPSNNRRALSACDELLAEAKALLRFEERGITVINPPAAQLLEKYSKKRDQIVVAWLTQDADSALAEAKLAATARGATGKANKVLLGIREAKRNLLTDRSALDALERKVEQFIHHTQLNSYLEAADKAEFKGNLKKAIDQYQEALYFLRRDDVDDVTQQEEIRRLEAKIEELQEKA